MKTLDKKLFKSLLLWCLWDTCFLVFIWLNLPLKHFVLITVLAGACHSRALQLIKNRERGL